MNYYLISTQNCIFDPNGIHTYYTKHDYITLDEGQLLGN